MPEIKHQFTGGKMNKDLDERLVPNGEYKDALNIQVSTSEGSDVGTIQNILGNSKILGQDFISPSAICVGSIADEKNDKLYYFITNNEELIVNGGFDGGYNGWWLQSGWAYVNGKIEGNNVSQHKKINQDIPSGIFIVGKEYEISFTVSGYVEGSIYVNLYNENGKGFRKHSFYPENKTYTFTGKVGTYNTTINQYKGRFYIGAYDKFTGNIDNISIIPKDSSIIEYDSRTNSITPVLVDTTGGVLKFNPNNIITGINIIDDLLFWTDNESEPKAINIQRSIKGTNSSGTVHTKLLDSGVITANNIEERHITVIKKSPTRPLVVEKKTIRTYDRLNSSGFPVSYTGVFQISNDPTQIQDDIVEIWDANTASYSPATSFANVSIGDKVKLYIPKDINENTSFELDWLFPSNINGSTSTPGNAAWEGREIVIREFGAGGIPPACPIKNYTIKGTLTSFVNAAQPSLVSDDAIQVSLPDNTGRIMVEFTVTGMIENIPNVTAMEVGYATQKFAIDLYEETEKLFEYKFPRFSYRYKYKDGEYSAFAPFTEVVFMPGTFDYEPRQGYNLGMTNRLSSIILSDYIPDDIPEGVIEVDILYKEDKSTNIYIVETIGYNDDKTILDGVTLINNWEKNSYEIKDETISSAIPSNQLLRPWDNVPRKALAQDITGNRIVYGNYLQGFNLETTEGDGDFYPELTHSLIQYPSSSRPSLPSIKSLREYQIGVVFIDKYGRETPVLSNPTGTFKIDKDKANTANRLKTGFSKALGFIDPDIQYFKFFMKEASGEYYNLAMDKHYDAGDGNKWLSFPSSDRNKVDIDTFLILKKANDSSELIQDPARYNILAIENEAPDYIKTKKEKIITVEHPNLYYASGYGNAIKNKKEIVIKYDNFENSTASTLHEIDDSTDGQGVELWAEFGIPGDLQVSKRYKITKITKTLVSGSTIDYDYNIVFSKSLGTDVNFISDDITGFNITGMAASSLIRFFKYSVQNRAEFDGKFFVKIFGDTLFNVLFEQIDIANAYSYQATSEKKIYSLKHNHTTTHHKNQTGLKLPLQTGTNIGNLYDGDGPFDPQSHLGWSSYACYFRDYIHANTSTPDPDGANNWDWGFWQKQVSGTYERVDMSRFRFGSTSTQRIHNGPMGTFLPGWAREFMTHTGPRGDTTYPFQWNYVAPITSCATFWCAGWGFGGPDNWFNGEANYNDHAPNEVWFIDEAPFVGISPTNHLDQSTIIRHVNGSNPGITTNTNDFTMMLGFGGVYSGVADDEGHCNPFNGVAYCVGGGYSTPPGPNNYWEIGNSLSPQYIDLDQNYDYNQAGTYGVCHGNAATTALVEKLNVGFAWRWKNDPHGAVYTISNPTVEQNTARYHYYNMDGSGNNYTNYALPHALNPNWTKNYSLTSIPALDAASWNPHGALGPIASGHSISFNSYTHGGVTAINTAATFMEDYAIYLESTTGQAESTATGRQTSIAVGMIVTSYDDGSELLNGTWNANISPKPYLAVKSVEVIGEYTKVGLTGYVSPLDATHCFTPTDGEAIVFQQPTMNGYSDNSAIRISWNKSDDYSGELLMAIGYDMEFVIGSESEGDEDVPPTTNPAVWETEPKEYTDLDIYYEADGYNAIKYNAETIRSVLPIGSTIIRTSASGGNVDNLFDAATVTDNTSSNTDDAVVTMDIDVSNLASGDILEVTRPDGTLFEIKVGTGTASITNDEFIVSLDMYGNYTLNWHNCYTFFNGVESNRVRDSFNLPYISNGVKASTTLRDKIELEHRKYGLIYSGIYNSNSRTNNLNQFIAAEKITKDVNPIYGSIQKLHSRDSDLVTLCEDKCLRILANKDALYNADGNPNLTATENVLGQTIPFSGEFGISTDPESFASESYRVYFTDRVRGTVMRLSKDGLTPISMYGMRDWFKDNLKLSNKLIGSYDDKKEEYNITLADRYVLGDELVINGEFLFDDSNWIHGGPGWDWVNSRKMQSNSGPHYFLNQILLTSITVGKSYEVTYTIGNPTDGSDMEGRLLITLHDSTAHPNNKYGNVHGGYYGVPEQAGTYTKTITVSTGWPIWTWSPISGHHNSITFHNKEITPGDGDFFNGTIDDVSVKEIIGTPTTLSFKEDVKGWVSFKSFVPENGVSVASDYYTMLAGKLYKHHDDRVDRNKFYGNNYNSTFNVILNEGPGSIKSFHALSYEGSQSKITQFTNTNVVLDYQPNTTYNDQEYYNLSARDGWSVESIITDKDTGYITDFIEKEGKWFANMNKFIDITL